MLVLCVDTSFLRGMIALFDTEKNLQLAETVWHKQGSHSEILVDECIKLLVQAGKDVQEVRAICVSIGPGSFTGIRVAINFARAFSYANKIEIWPVTTLTTLAYQHIADSDFTAVIYGFRDLFYYAHYEWRKNELHLKEQPGCTTLELLLHSNETSKFISDESSASKMHRVECNAPYSSTASAMIGAFLNSKPSGQPVEWRSLEPFYLRLSEPEEKLKINDMGS